MKSKLELNFHLNQSQVSVTLKSSSKLRERFYSLERSSVLLDIGHGTQDIGHLTLDELLEVMGG